MSEKGKKELLEKEWLDVYNVVFSHMTAIDFIILQRIWGSLSDHQTFNIMNEIVQDKRTAEMFEIQPFHTFADPAEDPHLSVEQMQKLIHILKTEDLEKYDSPEAA